MRNHSFLFKLAGWLFFVLGIVIVFFGVLGMFLPFLPGALLIFAGLALMGEKRVHAWFSKLLKRER